MSDNNTRKCENCNKSVIVRDEREGLIHVDGRYLCRYNGDTVAK